MTTTQTRETRNFKARELRASKEGDTKKIVGYAAVFNQPSEDLGGFVETILPGAFAKVLAGNPDIYCLFNHDNDCILGRTKNGTLVLAEDNIGLRFECTPAPTDDAADIVALIDRGDIDVCSFTFRVAPGGSEWRFPGTGPDQRTIKEFAEIFDVGPVTTAAYPQTEVAMRSRDAAREKTAPKGPRIVDQARLRLAEAES